MTKQSRDSKSFQKTATQTLFARSDACLIKIKLETICGGSWVHLLIQQLGFICLNAHSAWVMKPLVEDSEIEPNIRLIILFLLISNIKTTHNIHYAKQKGLHNVSLFIFPPKFFFLVCSSLFSQSNIFICLLVQQRL